MSAWFTVRRVGGITFLKAGRLNVSWSMSKPKPKRPRANRAVTWNAVREYAATIAFIVGLAACAVLAALAPIAASPLDRDTPECAAARAAPTDANIEACTGEPMTLDPAGFSLLATVYTPGGPEVYVLADNITGPDCLASLTRGVTPDVRSRLDRLDPSGEGHVPPDRPDTSRAVLSCETP